MGLHIKHMFVNLKNPVFEVQYLLNVSSNFTAPVQLVSSQVNHVSHPPPPSHSLTGAGSRAEVSTRCDWGLRAEDVKQYVLAEVEDNTMCVEVGRYKTVWGRWEVTGVNLMWENIRLYVLAVVANGH